MSRYEIGCNSFSCYFLKAIDSNLISITGDRKNYVPHFMIFTDKSSKSVVIAIKGTDNPKEKLYIPS